MRALLAGIALVAGMLAPSCAPPPPDKAPLPEALLVPSGCPPADGYDWYPVMRPTTRVMWLQTYTQQDFEALCKGGFACTWRFPENDLAIVWAQNPRDYYSDGQRQHEECHATHDHKEQHHSLLR